MTWHNGNGEVCGVTCSSRYAANAIFTVGVSHIQGCKCRDTSPNLFVAHEHFEIKCRELFQAVDRIVERARCLGLAVTPNKIDGFEEKTQSFGPLDG